MLICTKCGWRGEKGKKQVKGSIGVELLAWLLFILPGVLYSLWRLSSKETVCPSCKTASLIPADSPVGREMMERLATR